MRKLASNVLCGLFAAALWGVPVLIAFVIAGLISTLDNNGDPFFVMVASGGLIFGFFKTVEWIDTETRKVER